MVVFSKPTKTMGYHNSEPKQSTECLLQRTPTRLPKPYRSTAGHPTRLPPAPNPIRGRSSNGGSRITRDHKSAPAVRRPPRLPVCLPVRLPPIHRSAISNQQSAISLDPPRRYRKETLLAKQPWPPRAGRPFASDRLKSRHHRVTAKNQSLERIDLGLAKRILSTTARDQRDAEQLPQDETLPAGSPISDSQPETSPVATRHTRQGMPLDVISSPTDLSCTTGVTKQDKGNIEVHLSTMVR